MSKLPNIAPITDLRQDATTLVKRVVATREPLVITQRGRASVVMVSVGEYKRTQNEFELLRQLARGQKEIEAGEGHDLDEVFAEADALLKALQG